MSVTKKGPEHVPGKPKRLPEKSPKKTPAKSKTQSKRTKLYGLSGELMVSVSPTANVVGEPTITSTLVLDSLGQAFINSSLTVMVGEEDRHIFLEAEQVELLLKLLGIAENA